MCNTWKKSFFPAPLYLNPEEYGWYDTNNNSYEAVMTDQLPGPNEYESLRCSCRKNSLVCTKMCMRNDCPNEELTIKRTLGTHNDDCLP